MAALDDAARATKALLAPDEAVLFKQMFASDTSMEDIAKRIGLLRRATRKGKDMGAPIEEVTSAIDRLRELMKYIDVNSRLTNKRLNRAGTVMPGFHEASFRKSATIVKDPASWRRVALSESKNSAKRALGIKKSTAKEMSEATGRPMSFTEALSELGRVSPKSAAMDRRRISYLTSLSGESKAEAEAMNIIMALMGYR